MISRNILIHQKNNKKLKTYLFINNGCDRKDYLVKQAVERHKDYYDYVIVLCQLKDQLQHYLNFGHNIFPIYINSEDFKFTDPYEFALNFVPIGSWYSMFDSDWWFNQKMLDFVKKKKFDKNIEAYITPIYDNWICPIEKIYHQNKLCPGFTYPTLIQKTSILSIVHSGAHISYKRCTNNDLITQRLSDDHYFYHIASMPERCFSSLWAMFHDVDESGLRNDFHANLYDIDGAIKELYEIKNLGLYKNYIEFCDVVLNKENSNHEKFKHIMFGWAEKYQKVYLSCVIFMYAHKYNYERLEWINLSEKPLP